MKTVFYFFKKRTIKKLFYRENESRNQSAGGYGIGLSLAQAIVHQYGGSIHALALSNQHIQFQVVLPL